jgi:hypothetical protein
MKCQNPLFYPELDESIRILTLYFCKLRVLFCLKLGFPSCLFPSDFQTKACLSSVILIISKTGNVRIT